MCSSNGMFMVSAVAVTSSQWSAWTLITVHWQLLSFSHQREQYDIPYRGAVRQQHHESIDADAFAAGRRETVLQRADVVFVHLVRFQIAACTVLQLRLEAAALLHRIVQLAEGV